MIDFDENVSELGVEFDQGPRLLIAGFPRPLGRVANLPGFIKQLGNLFFIAEDQFADRVPHLLMLAGVAPQHMLQKKEILLMNFLFAFEIGVGLEQRDRLPVAPIGCLDAFLVELAPNIRNAPVNVRRHRDVANLLLHLC